MRLAPRAVLTLSCALALTAVAGCSSGSSKDAKSRTRGADQDVRDQRRSAPAPSITQYPLPSGSITNDETGVKRKDVAITACGSTSDGWQASGTAANKGTASETYNITIFFTTTQSTVLDYASTSVKVAAGQTEKWTAAAKFSAPKQVLCVLRGVG